MAQKTTFKAKLFTGWVSVRESYWFVPAVMALSAIALSFAATALDSAVGRQWLSSAGWMSSNKPAGARAVLSTVAGSMITVAGVTFSMTILSISHTTAQVGPRLLNNFMRDRGNQITLGVFISTFLYCLMVLRTVRNADSDSADLASGVQAVEAFVPQISVLLGIAMAVASVGVLIYFIHHVPESIHISNIIAGVGKDLQHGIDKQFPSEIGQPHEKQSDRTAAAELPDGFYDKARELRASGTGYIDYVDAEGLLKLAQKHDIVIRLQNRAGDFVTPRSVLLLAAPASHITDELASEMARMFIRANQRTATQNLRFVMNQLIEVAARALSPGVNDPFTAMTCLDWLQAGLERLAARDIPDANRFDGDQNLRIVAEPESFDSLTSLVFHQLLPYVAGDSNASMAMMRMLGQILLQTPVADRRSTLIRHAARLRKECRRNAVPQVTLDQLETCYRRMIRVACDQTLQKRVQQTGEWECGR